MYISSWFVIPFFGVIFGGGVILRQIACPKCGTAVCYDGTIWGERHYNGFVHRQCRPCGWDRGKLR